jgi:phosphoglucosamine mutase
MTKIEFGTDGVRGEAGVWPIDISGAAQIGHGIGTLLDRQTAAPKVLIGRDTRQSGEELANALARGLSLHSVQIVDVGVMTTAGVAYLTKHLNMDAGVVISASHNPWTENGIKVIGPDGCKLNDEQEQALEQAVNQPSNAASNNVKGHVQRMPELVAAYINHLVEPFKDIDLSGLTLALDCSNGAASIVAPQCFERLGCRTLVTQADPDGTNINHGCGSEAVREGRGELSGIVTSQRLNLGAAFDGDADRVVLVDETGHLVDGDHILYILATRFKNENRLPGNVIVTTSMANRGLDTALANHGIQVIRTPVGDKYILRELQNNGYVLGGEQSGHILIYDETHTTGDGIYTALFIASILAQDGCPPLGQLARPLRKSPQVIASARVASKPDLQTLSEYQREQQRIAEHLGPGVVINARYSGTEPLFRVMIEGMLQHQLADIAKCAVVLGRAVQAATGNLNGLIEVKDCTTGTTLSLEDL